MKTTRLLLSVWLLCTGLIIVSAQGSADYQVVPLPDKICMQKGKPFVLDNTTTIFLASGDESLAPEARSSTESRCYVKRYPATPFTRAFLWHRLRLTMPRASAIEGCISMYAAISSALIS